MSDVKITASPNGPYLVDGSIDLFASTGQPVDTALRPRVALCRCGGSANKPFCDGTHARIGFQDPKPTSS